MNLPHSCRYCSWCIQHNGLFWCDAIDKFVVNIGRVNRCKRWLGNEIKADAKDLDDTYKPRRKSKYKQEKIFEYKTDKQRRVK